MSQQKPPKTPVTRLSSPANPPNLEQSTAGRRAILRSLTGSALLVAVSERLPGNWQQPIIKSAVLPVHASPSHEEHTTTAAPASIAPQVSFGSAGWRTVSIGGIEAFRPFVTTWEVSSDNLNVTIPAVGEGLHYRVDWGDGAVDTGQTGYATHTYAAAGTYAIQISGSFKGQTFSGIDDAIQKAGRKQMRSIEQWGDIKWEHLSYAFYDCIHLQVHAADAPDLSRVTSLEGLFLDANSANPSLGHWDISNVTRMRWLLNSAHAFSTGNYDALLRGWAAQTVQRNVLFSAANAQYSLAAVTARNTLVTTYGWTINDAGLTDSIPSGHDPFIIHCEISSDNLRFMIPAVGEGLSYWIDWGDDTGAEYSEGRAEHEYQVAGTYVIQIVGTLKQVVFHQTPGENQLRDVHRWGDIEWVSMQNAFSNCRNLDIAAVDTPDLSKVTSMSGMLANTPSLTAENTAIGDWDISNVTDLSRLFSGATKFDQNIGNWDISSVTTLQSAFDGASLSPHNYDALLTGWSRDSITIPRGLTLSVGETKYNSDEAATARARLINQYNWTINDGGRARPFITTWKVEAGDLSITIPAYDFGAYTRNYTVDWGDGEVTENAIDQATHTYASAGTYTVQITGQLV